MNVKGIKTYQIIKIIFKLTQQAKQMQRPKISEYDQEIPQSHTAGLPTTSWGRATEL